MYNYESTINNVGFIVLPEVLNVGLMSLINN